MLDRVSARTGEQIERSVERTVCAEHFFKETNACESGEEPVALCECERKKQVRVCPKWPSRGHLLHLEIPLVSAFCHHLSSLIL